MRYKHESHKISERVKVILACIGFGCLMDIAFIAWMLGVI